LTPIGVETRIQRNLYVLVLFAPGSRKRILARRESRRPWLAPARGEVVRVGRTRLRVVATEAHVERHESRIEHRVEVVTERVRTRRRRRARSRPTNVVAMPLGDGSMVTTFLRYHVLIRVFDGNPDAWLAQLDARPAEAAVGDARFARWIRTRLRADPTLLAEIRRMVDTTPFWCAV
jgi:hypothetical protein